MGNNRQNNMKKKQPPKYKNPDPMSNVRDMGRYGIRIIRDIAKGKFNFYNEGDIFRNINFTSATMEEIKRKIYETNIHVTAMQFTYANSSDPVVQNLLMRDMKTVEAYELAYRTLKLVLDSGGDTRYIQILISKLPNYKYNM